ncbi:MAG: preprotein translocase subunit SecE [FCB group bacterium]|jgi:preprotein translocase subunit SecE|nr:preprotein translocase subunit SecE [FCB group bacterium]
MAKQTVALAERSSAFDRLKDFFGEVRVEMAKVAWPSRNELKQSTSIVMMVLGIFGLITFVYDLIFSRVLLALLSSLG